MAVAAIGKDYRKDIDGMRAIAIGLVTVFHFHLLPIGEAGFIGVDIFFVISGFLITRIILTELEQGKFQATTFYLARIRRLYPALTATLLGYLIVAYFLFLPDLFEELSREIILSQLYVINIYFWRTVNYFALQADQVPLLHMWSLAVEEQFYLFYPLFLLLVAKVFPRALFVVLLLSCVGSFALGWIASGWKPEAAFYLLPTRAWELIVGGILAYGLKRWQTPSLVIQLAGPVGIGLIVLAMVLYNPFRLFPGWFALLPVLGSAALLISGQNAQAPISRALSIAPMRFIGKISYPLYLVHWPVIITLRGFIPDYTYNWRLVGFILSIALAWMIYRFIEQPIRQRRILSSTRAFLGTAGALTFLMIAISVIGIRTEGFPSRFNSELYDVLAYAQDRATDYEACNWPNLSCPLGAENADTQVAIIGDSNAQALAGAFDLWLKDAETSGVLLFGSACAPVLQAGSRRCTSFMNAAIDRVTGDPGIKTIVLASVWRQAYEQDGFPVNGAYLRGAAAHKAFADQLIITTEQLIAAGKTVVILEPLYAVPHNVPLTLARNLAFGQQTAIDLPLSDHQEMFAPLNLAFDRAEAAGAERISFIQDLCSDQTCPGLLDGKPLFSDNIHVRFGLSEYFATLLAKKLPL